MPFVGLNELAGQSEEGEKKLPGLTSSGLYLSAQPMPGRRIQFICFIAAQSLREWKGVLQQIPLANCWSNEQFGRKKAPVSHCSVELTSD